MSSNSDSCFDETITAGAGSKKFRIVGFIDIDAFECQAWQRNNPDFVGFPCVVADKSGRIVSMTYEAKSMGINRSIRLHEAKNIYPDLHVFEKPIQFNKPDSQLTRDASWEITTAIMEYCAKNDKDEDIIVEYRPNDQWFFDLTKYVDKMISSCSRENIRSLPCLQTNWKNMYLENDKRQQNEEIKTEFQNNLDLEFLGHQALLQNLLIGGAIVHEITEHILQATRFHSSAGIGENILLAKVACQYNKPKSVTILTKAGLRRISPKIPFRNIPGFGGPLGDKVAQGFPFIDTLARLKTLSPQFLQTRLTEEEAEYVRKLAYGICKKEVKSKLMTESVSCGKNNLRIRSTKSLKHNLRCLSGELFVRLEEERLRNHRIPEDDAVKVFVTYYKEDEDDSKDRLKTDFPAYYNSNYDSKDLSNSCARAIHEAFPLFSSNGYRSTFITITSFRISVTRFKLLKPASCKYYE